MRPPGAGDHRNGTYRGRAGDRCSPPATQLGTTYSLVDLQRLADYLAEKTGPARFIRNGTPSFEKGRHCTEPPAT